MYYYRDYYWKKGMPTGTEKSATLYEFGMSYKIVSDAYHKRISIEEYSSEGFQRIIYDSLFLDFRKLNPMEQVAWERSTVYETEDERICQIRDINGRFILKEVLSFQGELCVQCDLYSPHETYLGTQQIFYKKLGAEENAVMLFDITAKPVMKKIYELNEDGEFGDVINEEWEFSPSKRGSE